MKEINFSTSTCRYCRFYKPEGRRGGACQRLGVPVQSSWEACNLASPPFDLADNTLKQLEDIIYLEASIQLESSRKIASKTSSLEVNEGVQNAVVRQLE